MIKLFGEPTKPHSEIPQRDMDLAFAMQHRFEEVFFHLLNELYKRVPLQDLVMAGGCALNSVGNGKLFTETPFRRTWIQPAAGDEGLAIGAAMYTYNSILKQPHRYVMKNSYLGPEFSESRIEFGFEKSQLEVSETGARPASGGGRRPNCRRQRRWMVSGPHEIGPTRVG